MTNQDWMTTHVAKKRESIRLCSHKRGVKFHEEPQTPPSFVNDRWLISPTIEDTTPIITPKIIMQQKLWFATGMEGVLVPKLIDWKILRVFQSL